MSKLHTYYLNRPEAITSVTSSHKLRLVVKNNELRITLLNNIDLVKEKKKFMNKHFVKGWEKKEFEDTEEAMDFQTTKFIVDKAFEFFEKLIKV